jgi:hypothetical protein
MNRHSHALIAFAILLLSFSLVPSARARGRKTPAGEEFFMVASLDQSRSQLLLKRPTEVTMLAKVTDKTTYVDENGKPIHLSDLRAGDTVWAITSGSGDNIVAVRVRKGPMTVATLHQYYLDYPEIK